LALRHEFNAVEASVRWEVKLLKLAAGWVGGGGGGRIACALF